MSDVGLQKYFKAALCLLVIFCTPLQAKWHEWDGFKAAYVSSDGRIIDHGSSESKTVSEGQAYALFFALVAGDKEAFERILTWTENNLAQGDLGKHLPAWLWGKTPSNEWKVIDTNSASDADLWLAYTLHEAGLLWCHAPYSAKARMLGDLIMSREVMEVPSVGLSLLPGMKGFVREDGHSVELNPSYAPPFILQRLGLQWKDDPRWAQLYLGNQTLLLESAKLGAFPDWVEFSKGDLRLPEGKTKGSYDAIRVYTWLSMSNESEPSIAASIQLIRPTISHIAQKAYVPESFDLKEKRSSSQAGPPGFHMAMAPMLKQLGHVSAFKSFRKKSAVGNKPDTWLKYGYYNSVLNLFAGGWLDGKYAFSEHGALKAKSHQSKGCN